VGVGPGDPELLTLKAARILQETQVIAAPVSQPDGDSYALSIASDFLNSQQAVLKLHFPMVRDVATRTEHRRAAAQRLADELTAGRDVAFLTEGDPLLHSTFGHVLRHLPDELPVEVIPGVSSITAAAAQMKKPLVNADQKLAIIPAASGNLPALRQALLDFDTVVLLKVNRVFDRLLDLLDDVGLLQQAALVERASHAAGRVMTDIHELRGADVHYLSLLVVHTGKHDDES